MRYCFDHIRYINRFDSLLTLLHYIIYQVDLMIYMRYNIKGLTVLYCFRTTYCIKMTFKSMILS